jgi:hypothetical protein
MDFTPTPCGGRNRDTFSHTWDQTSVQKVHFGNQANDKMDHLDVDFDTLQVQVAARN